MLYQSLGSYEGQVWTGKLYMRDTHDKYVPKIGDT